MKYQAPFGSPDPNAGYVDKNVPGAVAGSKVPAKAVEHPQREMHNLILKSGFVPSEGDLSQLLQAVRGQKLNYVVAGGTANVLTATPDPALASYVAGFPLRLAITADNNGGVSLNVSGLGPRSVVKRGGANIVPGDFRIGDIVPLVFDGNYWRATAPMRSDLREAVFAPTTTQKFTAVGAFNFVVPQGVTAVQVRAWGGGGGGGYAQGFNSSSPSGGASCGYVERRFAVTAGDTISGTVGAGGVGGSASPAQNGQPGLASTVTVGGVTITANGGGGGINTNTANAVANAPAGGAHANGDFGIRGEDGHLGFRPGGGAIASGGEGGAAPLGGGAAAGGFGNPGAGNIPGGGGGATSDTNIAGATGGRGEVHIIYVTP